jgi:prolyl oligopeptidase
MSGRRLWAILRRGVILALLLQPLLASATQSTIPADQYHWLDGQFDPAAVAWSKTQTQRTVQILTASSVFPTIEKEVAALQNANAPIPQYFLLGSRVVRYRQDAAHPSGLLEVAMQGRGAVAAGDWKAVLDLADLNMREHQNYELMFLDLAKQCLPPAYDRCLLPLSPGGASNIEYREFDLSTGQFVQNGFRTPPNRAFFAWLDKDTLLIEHSLDGSPTLKSGFPAILRIWKRGTPLSAAKAIFTAQPTDSLFDIDAVGLGAQRRGVLSVAKDYSTFDLKIVDRSGAITSLGLPTKLKNFGDPLIAGNDLIFQLADSATMEGKPYAPETIFAYNAAAEAGSRRISTVFVPPPGTYVNDPFSGFSASRSDVGFVLDRNLQKTLFIAKHDPNGWVVRSAMKAPAGATMHIVSADPAGDSFIVRQEGFLQPARLIHVALGARPKEIETDKAIIDASAYVSEVRSARSQDGTLVDYYIVRPKHPRPGPVPTIIEGYGSFGVNVEPTYFSGGLGQSLVPWLSRGGAFVVAAIRGGGERGAIWHESAIGIHRQRSYDDFIAVAEDLVHSGFTTPSKIGAYGRSAGGLLSAVMATERPDLFGACLVSAPITDVFDLSKSNSGIGGGQKAELGDWDDPKQIPSILAYSPYQNIHAGVRYPRILMTTSTQDNQVGPGQARKFVAKMQSVGANALLLEGPTGGHGFPNAFANPREFAMQMTFFITTLMNATSDSVPTQH